MNEFRAILDAADSSNGRMYLATVVDVDGSAYRRPGARMLIMPEGQNVGMISGGCLERDLCRQAPALCKEGARLVSFDTRSESTDFTPKYNLGCNGIIYVLVEPVTHDDRCPLRFLRQTLETQTSRVVGTVYHLDGNQRGKLGDRMTAESMLEAFDEFEMRPLIEQVDSTGIPVCCEIPRTTDETSLRLFVEKISPPQPLWIFGAGDDAMPMARIANELGWAVTVIDDRAANLSSSRFPDCSQVLAFGIHEIRKKINPTSETVALLMTHSFKKDEIYLPWLCQLNLPYIGLLGPKSRTAKLVRRLHDLGTLPAVENFNCLRTPVGLDIGATNPAQIALSIAAEIISFQSGRSGGSLSLRSEPIHEPVSHELLESPAPIKTRLVETK